MVKQKMKEMMQTKFVWDIIKHKELSKHLG